MSMPQFELGGLSRIRTGKLDANASSEDGAFPFFTCAREPLKIASYSYDCECVLIAGNGDLNVKYYSGKFDAYQRTYIIESVDKSVLDVRYLFHFMDQYLEQLREQSIGGIIKYIKIGNLTGAKIPLPPMSEQRRIAAILDKAAALRARRREAIAKLDLLLQSVFLEMFGDPVRNSNRWPKSSLSDIAQIHTGKTPPSVLDGMFGGDIPFVTPGDLEGDPIRCNRSLTQSGATYTKVVRAGSALVGCIGTIGKMAKAAKDCAFNQQINAVEWDSSLVDDDFGIAALAFAKDQMVAFSSSTTIPILNKSGFSKVEIVVPPLSLQRDFSCRVAAVKSVRLRHESSLECLESMFSSLQQKAFHGEL